MSDYSELKKLAEAATPQDFDSAEEKVENGYIECPHCGGSGEVELEADYCNYDNAAIGVQFYGIGHEFGAAEAYYRGVRPAVVLALIADLNALAAQRDEGLAREAELAQDVSGWKAMAQVAMDGKDELRFAGEALQQRLAEAEKLLRLVDVMPSGATAELKHGWWSRRNDFLAHPGCADGEQPS